MNFLTFINKDKGTVVIKASDTMEELYNEFFEFYYKYQMTADWRLFKAFEAKYGKMIKKISGVATCNIENGDEFCEEFGLALAKERFMKTFEAYRAKMYEMIIDNAVTFGAKAVYRLERSYERKKDRYDMIDELISDLRENN